MTLDDYKENILELIEQIEKDFELFSNWKNSIMAKLKALHELIED